MILEPGFEAWALALSVLLHVAWNLVARHQKAESEPLWWVLLGHLVLIAPWGLWQFAHQVRWMPVMAELMAVSAAANALYFFGLQQAYRHAPVALVYPLVRSSPVLIALWAMLLFGEELGRGAWVGILISVLGLLAMAASGRSSHEGRALPWALLAMLCTSLYSTSDKIAALHLPSLASVMGYLSVGYAAAFIALTLNLRWRTGVWMPRERPQLSAWLVGVVGIGGAYGLVIHTMRRLPAAEVVAYSNAGIVLATLVSIFVFGERHRWQARLGAALLVAMGLVVLSRWGALAA